MANLSMIDNLLSCVANIYAKLKKLTSIAFIKKALFTDVIPKFAI